MCSYGESYSYSGNLESGAHDRTLVSSKAHCLLSRNQEQVVRRDPNFAQAYASPEWWAVSDGPSWVKFPAHCFVLLPLPSTRKLRAGQRL